MRARIGVRIRGKLSLPGPARPFPMCPPAGSGTSKGWPWYSNFSSRFQIMRQASMYSRMRTIGFSYGTPWKPSITCGPEAPRPRMKRSPYSAFSVIMPRREVKASRA